MTMRRHRMMAAALAAVLSLSCAGALAQAYPAHATRIIVTNPPGVTVKYVGDNIDLTVAATGTAPLFYQWQVRGTNIPGATTATQIGRASCRERV